MRQAPVAIGAATSAEMLASDLTNCPTRHEAFKCTETVRVGAWRLALVRSALRCIDEASKPAADSASVSVFASTDDDAVDCAAWSNVRLNSSRFAWSEAEGSNLLRLGAEGVAAGLGVPLGLGEAADDDGALAAPDDPKSRP